MKNQAPLTNIILLPIVGFISGIVSFYAMSKTDFNYIPGAIFGLFIGCYYVIFRKKNMGSIIFLVFFSTIAFFSAYWITFLLYMLLASVQELAVISFFLGGVVGALLLHFSYILVIDSPSMNSSRLLFATLGGLLGFSWLFLSQNSFTFDTQAGLPDSFMALFVIWQTGIALLTGILFKGSTNVALKIVKKPLSSRK